MPYKRQLYPKIEAELATKEITIITGMRRVGKTTALQHLYDLVDTPNKLILDLENPLHRKVFEEKNYDSIWNNLKPFGITNSSKPYIFIDEVQNLPEISRAIKYLYDHYDVKFILTGSSSYYLRNLFPESLAGRKIIFELYPLNFSEFLTFKQVKHISPNNLDEKSQQKNKISHQKLINLYNEYMEYGGFPSVVLENDQNRKKLLLSEIFTSYFEKDAKNLADFNDMSKLRDLILTLIPRIGQKIDVQKLAITLSVSRATIYSYLSFLEQTYFITMLNRHSGSIDRQAAGSKKLFMCDTGIINTLGKISQGQLFEQSVFQCLRDNYKLAYYNKGVLSEIDFILDSNIALEIKYSATKKDFSSLNRRKESLKISEGYIVTHEFSDNVQSILSTDL